MIFCLVIKVNSSVNYNNREFPIVFFSCLIGKIVIVYFVLYVNFKNISTKLDNRSYVAIIKTAMYRKCFIVGLRAYSHG